MELLVVPGVDPFDAMVQTAANLKASRLVTGVSARMDSEELAPQSDWRGSDRLNRGIPFLSK